MRTKQKKHSLAMRLAALGLTLVMIIPMIGNLGITAKAATSLMGIENIKNVKRQLNILEIVPKENSGSIGYYVGGQEPTANWLATLSKISGSSARENYANNTLFANLQAQNRELMGTSTESDATKYPLAFQGPYTEIMPWDIASLSSDDQLALKAFSLVAPDEAAVKGKITKNNDGSGDYAKVATYTFVPDGSGATFVENTLWYEYGQRMDAPTTYYYNVIFERVKLSDDPKELNAENSEFVNINDYMDTPLYICAEEDLENGVLSHYEHIGKLSDKTFTIDIKRNTGTGKYDGYFVARANYETRGDGQPPISTGFEDVVQVNFFLADGVTKDEAQVNALKGQTLYKSSTSSDGKRSYTAVVVDDKFDPKKEEEYYKALDNPRSYFAITNPSEPYRDILNPGEVPYFESAWAYYLVGGNKSGYTFSANEDSENQYIIKYDTVYYTGGYVSNEWFKRYVLDMDTNKFEEFNIKFDSLTPDQLTVKRIQAADLVVISSGIDLTAENPSSIPYTADIDKYYNEIILKPRVVDLSISTAAPLDNNAKLHALKDGNVSSKVTDKNVYYFAPAITVDNQKSTTSLATNLFYTAFDGLDKVTENPYQVVVDEIVYENTLRSAATGLGTLPTDVSIATCIRYVINTHRTVNKKTSLRVLDVQPVAKYDQIGEVGFDSNDSYLTVDTVVGWLPNSMLEQIAKKDNDGNVIKVNNKVVYDITITHMSTNALVGKIEDLSEEYDLIYIGAATSNEDLGYVDMFLGNVNGVLYDDYYYANIGALAKVDSRKLGGLLANDGALTKNANWISTRYSGNDLTPKKKAELMEFANAGMPIVLAGELADVSDWLSAGQSTLRVKAELVPGKNELKATPYFVSLGDVESEIGAQFNIEYVWTSQEKYTIPLINTEVWGGTNYLSYNGSTIPVENGHRYRCKVTVSPINGTPGTASSQTVEFIGAMDAYFDAEIGSWETTNSTFTGSSTKDVGGILGGLTGEKGRVFITLKNGSSNLSSSYKATYQWYTFDESGNKVKTNDVTSKRTITGDTYWQLPSNATYCCEITITQSGKTEAIITSPAYQWHGSVKTSELKGHDAGTSDTVYNLGAGGNISLNDSAIDCNSLMYAALNSVVNRENVMAETQLTQGQHLDLRISAQQEVLVKYLNLSRPSLKLMEEPTPLTYDAEKMVQSGAYTSSVDLNFKFQINNPTDATPIQTRYTCKLYIDQNGDGRHSEDERVYDFQIREHKADGSRVSVENGTLQANQQEEQKTYSLTRQLKASQFSGLVAWKLEVVKVEDSTVHASKKGYTYIKPEAATPINVLQIKNSNKVNLNTVDPNTVDLNDSSFKELYKDVLDAGLYNITVVPTTVTQLNNEADPFAELNKYEMIVLGFGDAYGELNAALAQAVAQYIETGKAVLFTHDTTSTWNRSKEEYSAESSSTPLETFLDNLFGTGKFRGYWGYYFNKIIRDKVGLDRYGVTNPNPEFKDVKTGSNGSITSDEEVKNLEKAGYTVAYFPGDKGESAGQTQGFSNLTVGRYQYDAREWGNNAIDQFIRKLPILGELFESIFYKTATTDTTVATQVNRGHITEYPFQIEENLTIGQTHEQYYQLNMNAEDITVWYCLSDNGNGNFELFKNDATNAYYVYNRGNITYSGAGHTDLKPAEKKLFVNTLVAAYRAGHSAPSVAFKTVAGTDTTTQLVPLEYGSDKFDSLSGQQYIYFEVQDTNLDSDKKVTVDLYYEHPDGSSNTDLKGIGEEAVAPVVKLASLGDVVYRVDTGAAVNRDNLSSGVLYRTAIPTEVLNYFAACAKQQVGKEQSEKGLKLYLKATTTIKAVGTIPDLPYTGFDVLTLQELGLLRLE